MKPSIKHFTLIVILLVGVASAQVSTGTPPYGSFGGGPFDNVNLGNLNVNFAIPVLHKAGRGMLFTYDLSYDSSIWTPVTSNGVTQWQPAPNWGWRGATEAKTGYISFSTSSQVNGQCTTYSYYNWVYHDSFGAQHSFPGSASRTVGVHCGGGLLLTAAASDGSGYTLTGGQGPASGVVTGGDGKVIAAPFNTTSGAGTLTDANGNQLTVNSSLQFFDTLSTSTPVLSVAGSGTTTFTYTAPSGGAAYKMTYTSYTVETAFGFSSGSPIIHEYGPLSVPLVSSIALPDDTVSHPDHYTFIYENGPSSCSPCVTGRIQEITLPTGGTITFTYTGGTNNTGIYKDGSTADLQRAVSPGGTWTYTRAIVSGQPGPGSTWTTTVADPQGNHSVINFAEDSTMTSSTTTATYNFYETQRQINQLISGTQTLLLTTERCYNGNYTNCNTTTVGSPIDTIDTYYQPANGRTRASHVAYNGSLNGSGLVSLDWEYDYGVTIGAALTSFTPLRKTTISYAALGNIIDHPSQVSVTDGSGNLLSKTSYSYDEPAYPVQTTSGTPQHTTVSGSRGNLTTLTSYSTSSATLSKHFEYYDTGTLYRSWDVNGSSTSYTSYTYGATTSCGNSFATTVTSPPTPNASLGLSVNTVWNCTGGVATSTTDPNNSSVSASYSDPYFWRPASSQDQLLNTTNYYYTPPNGTTIPASVESSMIFNGSSSISEQLTTLDSLGRVQYSQQQEGVGSGSYDSTETAYDVLGRPYQTSMPYVGGKGQGSSSAAVTTTSYDALSRVTQVQDGETLAGYASYSYSQNDVLQVNGPAPTGENLKQKQLEYDGIGRLISVCEVTAGTTLAPSGSCGQQTPLPLPGLGYLTTYTYGVASANPTLTVAQNAQPGSSGQQTRTYVYDLLGRLIQETNPETGNQAPGTTKYTFDSDSTGTCSGTYNGDLVKKIDNRGNTTCYTYDSLHRVQSIAYTSGSPDYANTAAKAFVYDAATYGSTAMSNAMGRLAEAYTGPSSAKVTDEFFSYSKRGELTDMYQCTPHSGTPYYHTSAGFWANGAVSALALVSPASLLPSQTIGVDTEGRPSSVTANSSQNSNVVGSTTYSLANYQTTVNFGSGDSDVFTLDPKTGRLTNYTFTVGSNSDVGALTWNPNGSLSSLHITDTVPTTTDSQTCNYAHDDMARVASVNCGNSIWRQNFSYDAFGNISKDSTGYTGLTFSASYSNATNQFTSIGTMTPTYDADGRLTYDTVNHYTWDADSKLYTVDTSPSTTVTYDALGRMVEKALGSTYTEIVYSPLGGKLAVMSGQTTLQKGFVPLPTGATAVYTSSGLAYYRHTDHLGSSRLATAPSRTLYSSTAYAPFGESYKQAGTADLSFTGHDQDTASGMYDTLYRKQMPVQGRWLLPDPAGLGAVDPTNPQTWNRYAYVANNPLSFVDPLGLQLVFDSGCVYDETWDDSSNTLNSTLMFCMGFGGGGGGNAGGGDGGSGGSGGGGRGKQINKTWGKTFPCNESATQVMSAVQNDMGQFADNNGFFAANFPDQPLTMGGQYSIQPGITMMSNDALSNPVTFGMLPVANLVVNVTSESANGWTFTTVPSQHFFDGTVSFSSTDAGNGNITFSVGVNANWVSPFTHYTIGPVIMAGENSTWNNMVSNVQAYCQAPAGS